MPNRFHGLLSMDAPDHADHRPRSGLDHAFQHPAHAKGTGTFAPSVEPCVATMKVDSWPALAREAHEVLDRILRDLSELLDLWEEGGNSAHSA
jgi:hypothetical protein